MAVWHAGLRVVLARSASPHTPVHGRLPCMLGSRQGKGKKSECRLKSCLVFSTVTYTPFLTCLLLLRVARDIWNVVSEILEMDVGLDFESRDCLWIRINNKRHIPKNLFPEPWSFSTR